MKNSQRYFESRAINEKDPSHGQKVGFVSRNGGVATEDPPRSASHKHLASLRDVWEVGKEA